MAPLSAADRQWRCRARRDADTERKQKYLESERQRWRRDVEQGKKKKISDLSERGKGQLRKKWSFFSANNEAIEMSNSYFKIKKLRLII